jgi:glycosyltransferase involved in cell wall biosynthesis
MAQEKKEHPPTIVYMGEVNYLSGLDIAVKAITQIKRKITRIRLFIIGKGSTLYERELRNLVTELDLDENVFFVGSKKYTELPLFLKESDIGLACFRPINWRRYAFPLKVIEYMTAGLPIIGTVGTETENIIERYNCGDVISLNTEELSQSICSLLIDKERYNRLSSNAKKCSPSFDWALLMRKYYNCISGS